MKKGQLVEFKNITGFKGVLLEILENMSYLYLFRV